MIQKEIIDKIDLETQEAIQEKIYCDTPKVPIKRHGLCEVKFIQAENQDLLYSYSEKQKVTIDSSFKVQLIHIQSSGRRQNAREFGLLNQGEYSISGVLVVVCYTHSTIETVIKAFESMENVSLGEFDTNTENNARRFFRLKRDEKNYNPETRIFSFNYVADLFIKG